MPNRGVKGAPHLPGGGRSGAKGLVTRKAIVPDAPAIHTIIAAYAREGILLPRSLGEICENVRDFTVVERRGEIIGCGALHLYGQHLAEVRSIAVRAGEQRSGAGSTLMSALMAEAREHRIGQLCLFTRSPQFFGKLGFVEAPHASLPDKIFKDCRNCPRFANGQCDETAMVFAGAEAGLPADTAFDDEIIGRPVLPLLS
jgi:amino-acid N-acetyltransferase